MLPFLFGCCCKEQRGTLTVPKKPTRRHRIVTPDWEMLMRDDRDILDTITVITTSGILDE